MESMGEFASTLSRERNVSIEVRLESLKKAYY